MDQPAIRNLFRNASKAFQELNAGLGLSATQPQPAAEKALEHSPSGKAASPPRTVLSYRASLVRPIDPDNLAGATKYLTDALVRCGLVDGDSPQQIEIRWSQEKVAHYDEEKLTLTIENR